MPITRLLSPGLLLVVVCVLPLASCSDDAEAVAGLEPERTLVDLEFTDASVPPEYHRSWTLLLDDAAVVSSVTDYEEVVGGGTVDTPAETWADFLADLPDLVDTLQRVADDGGDVDDCAGGTALELSVHEAATDGDVARADADDVAAVRVGSCQDGGADAIEDVQETACPLATLVDLPGQVREWSGGCR